MNFLIPFVTFILTMNFTFYYLHDFKISESKYIRFSQILSPLLIIIFIGWFVYESSNILSNYVLFFEEDKNRSNNVNIGAQIEVNRDAGEAFGGNIGFAWTVVGIAGAVGKAISNSTLPPLQRYYYR
jgi:hypothetical protein